MNVQRIGMHELPLPRQQSMEAAGYDLCASEPATIHPGARSAIPTGFAFQIPAGMCGLVWPRSGLAVNKGIDTLAGLIDSDYRGEVKAVLINHGEDPVQIFSGDRIAQLVVVPCLQGMVREVEDLGSTERGAGGFGSTGS